MYQPRNDSRLPPLQILPAMLHAVFIQTADVFNTPARQQPRAVIYTNAQVNTSIPSFNERFQYALDQLEMDILSAKAALRRDLTGLRTAAQAREEALMAERARQEEQRRKEEMARRMKEAEERARREKEKREKEKREKEKEEAERKARLAAEEAEARRKKEEVERKAAQAEAARKKVTPPTPTVGANFVFAFATDKKSSENPAPPPPPPAPVPPVGATSTTSSGGSGGFEDFLASLPVGGDHSTDIGGGQPLQPLEESDLFGEFNDLFNYPGT